MLACSIVGGPETVRAGLRALVERTGADELMIVSDMYDPEAPPVVRDHRGAAAPQAQSPGGRERPER